MNDRKGGMRSVYVLVVQLLSAFAGRFSLISELSLNSPFVLTKMPRLKLRFMPYFRSQKVCHKYAGFSAEAQGLGKCM